MRVGCDGPGRVHGDRNLWFWGAIRGAESRSRLLFGACRRSSLYTFLVRLRMRFAGIASSDDRAQANDPMEITSSPVGSWQNERELVDALRQRCEELPRYFAARGERGLTRAEFVALQHDQVEATTNGDGVEGDGSTPPDERPAPDVLDEAPEAAGTAGDQDAHPIGDKAPAESAVVRLTAIKDSRWLPGSPGGTGSKRQRVNRVRQARAPGRETASQTGDFTAVLKDIRGSLHRDRRLIQTVAMSAGLSVTPPTDVIFTADPPMADLDAATVFGDLAAEAAVVWVVTGKLGEFMVQSRAV